MCGRLLSTPYWGPGPQPRHVPWLGIELATLWLTGPCLIHWATPARVACFFFSWYLKVIFGFMKLVQWYTPTAVCSSSLLLHNRIPTPKLKALRWQQFIIFMNLWLFEAHLLQVLLWGSLKWLQSEGRWSWNVHMASQRRLGPSLSL